MKQSQRVIRNGDYYQVQVSDQAFYPNKAYKKQESQLTIPQANDSIITQIPSFQTARSNYYYSSQKAYSSVGPDQLLHQLQDILRNEQMNDQDKQDVIKLIKEVKQLKEQPLLSLQQPKNRQKKDRQSTQFRKIQLKAKLDIKQLEKKVAILQKFSYPEIETLQHQLEILLGQKKTTHLSNIQKDEKNERNKQDIDNLFATFSSITCLNNLPSMVNKIYGNNGKYVEIASWVSNAEKIISFQGDYLAELKQDELLLDKLEQNFKKNIATVKTLIEQIKKSPAK